ncbi:MAG TPA: hypothetical protein DCL86_04245 [Bacteroidales bacterium]|nr:hypothetical protein [Bacteroidales bacterium]
MHFTPIGYSKRAFFKAIGKIASGLFHFDLKFFEGVFSLSGICSGLHYSNILNTKNLLYSFEI